MAGKSHCSPGREEGGWASALLTAAARTARTASGNLPDGQTPCLWPSAGSLAEDRGPPGGGFSPAWAGRGRGGRGSDSDSTCSPAWPRAHLRLEERHLNLGPPAFRLEDDEGLPRSSVAQFPHLPDGGQNAHATGSLEDLMSPREGVAQCLRVVRAAS